MKKMSKMFTAAFMIAVMTVMFAMSAFAATGTFYVSKDNGATYQAAPSHANNTINSVTLAGEEYTIQFKKISWVVAGGQITEFNGKKIDYDGNTSIPLSFDYKPGQFNLKGGGTVTGTPVTFTVKATLFGLPHNHKYNSAVLVIK